MGLLQVVLLAIPVLTGQLVLLGKEMSLGVQDMATTEAWGKMRMCQEEFDVPLAFQATGCWLWLELSSV